MSINFILVWCRCWQLPFIAEKISITQILHLQMTWSLELPQQALQVMSLALAFINIPHTCTH